MINNYPKFPIGFSDEKRLELQYRGLSNSHCLKNISIQNVTDFENEGIEDTKPSSLEILKSLRLGQRVEYFFEQYLQFSSRYLLKAANIQIMDSFRTIGELDYILWDLKKEEFIHLELTYKFYCYDESVSEDEKQRWIGPNRKDSFIQKLNKLSNKQFPLLFTHETKVLLKDKEIDIINIHQQICFYAQLFIPYGKTRPTNLYMNPKCIVGYWIHFDNFGSKEFRNYTYYIPHKQDWPIDVAENLSWYSFDDVIDVLRLMYQDKYAPLLWIKKDTNTYEKCFVVWW